jgi:hypothetical protein
MTDQPLQPFKLRNLTGPYKYLTTENTGNTEKNHGGNFSLVLKKGQLSKDKLSQEIIFGVCDIN